MASSSARLSCSARSPAHLSDVTSLVGNKPRRLFRNVFRGERKQAPRNSSRPSGGSSWNISNRTTADLTRGIGANASGGTENSFDGTQQSWHRQLR